MFIKLALSAVFTFTLGCACVKLPVATTVTATPGTSLLDPGVNRALDMELIGWDAQNSSPATATLNFLYRATDDASAIELYVDGTWFELTYVPSRFGFIGGADQKTIEYYPQFTTSDNQLAQNFIVYYSNDLDYLYAGYGLYGIPTKSSEIDALTGNATFTGRVGVSLRDDQLNFTDGKGPAVLRVDFQQNTLEGELDLSDSGFSDSGYEMNSTRITVAPTAISGAEFMPNLVFINSDFGFDAAPNVVTDGRFYGVDGSSVGGSFSGNATVNGSATDVSIQGVFTAEQ